MSYVFKKTSYVFLKTLRVFGECLRVSGKIHCVFKKTLRVLENLSEFPEKCTVFLKNLSEFSGIKYGKTWEKFCFCGREVGKKQTAATHRGEGIQGQPARAAFFVAENG